jgi:hypothetical protein
MNSLKQLHNEVTAQVIDQRKREIENFREQQAEATNISKHGADRVLAASAAAGVNMAKIDALRQERIADGDNRYKAVEAKLIKESQKRVIADDPSGQLVALPEGAHALRPSWLGMFSTHDEKAKLTATSDITTQDVLTGGGCKDYWNWASGGGWGCLGSGVGEIQTWIDFGFWFRPPTSRFYSVMPHFQFRGFYIVQADDGFWDCKSARSRLSVWTNCYQYNWKGWNHVDVLDLAGDNINRNDRFDVDRYPLSSYLLGGGDWAWIQCTIGLYARAQGGGSYVKNDFASGNANYLCVPECYVW